MFRQPLLRRDHGLWLRRSHFPASTAFDIGSRPAADKVPPPALVLPAIPARRASTRQRGGHPQPLNLFRDGPELFPRDRHLRHLEAHLPSMAHPERSRSERDKFEPCPSEGGISTLSSEARCSVQTKLYRLQVVVNMRFATFPTKLFREKCQIGLRIVQSGCAKSPWRGGFWLRFAAADPLVQL